MLRSPRFLLLSRLLFLILALQACLTAPSPPAAHCERHAGHTGQAEPTPQEQTITFPAPGNLPCTATAPTVPPQNCAHLTPCATTTSVPWRQETRALARSPIQSLSPLTSDLSPLTAYLPAAPHTPPQPIA